MEQLYRFEVSITFVRSHHAGKAHLITFINHVGGVVINCCRNLLSKKHIVVNEMNADFPNTELNGYQCHTQSSVSNHVAAHFVNVILKLLHNTQDLAGYVIGVEIASTCLLLVIPD